MKYYKNLERAFQKNIFIKKKKHTQKASQTNKQTKKKEQTLKQN